MDLLYELNAVTKKPRLKDSKVPHERVQQKSQFEKDTGIEPELLWALVWGNGYTVSYVAELFSCGCITIREGMRQYRIPYHGYSYYDKEQIYQQRTETVCRCDIKRRLKESVLFEDFTEDEWFKKVNATGGICPFCGYSYEEGGGLTLDHILPVSKAPPGFRYTIDDVNSMCRSCNSRKSNSIQPKDLNIVKPYSICVNGIKTDTDKMLGGEEQGKTFLSNVISAGRVAIPKAVRAKLELHRGDIVRACIWKE